MDMRNYDFRSHECCKNSEEICSPKIRPPINFILLPTIVLLLEMHLPPKHAPNAPKHKENACCCCRKFYLLKKVTSKIK